MAFGLVLEQELFLTFSNKYIHLFALVSVTVCSGLCDSVCRVIKAGELHILL